MRRVLIVVENLPVPFDRRVWQVSLALRDAGWDVTVISPTGAGAERRHEVLEGITVFRHPVAGATRRGPLGYALEYAGALAWELRLSLQVARDGGVDVFHACNPPDDLFVVGTLLRRRYGTKVVFDHHDTAPELYESKFGRRGVVHRVLLALERRSFRTADVVLANNASYADIAVERGGIPAERVVIVRNGPDLTRVGPCQPDPTLRPDGRHLVVWMGVLDEVATVDHLLLALRHLVFVHRRDDVHVAFVGGGPGLDDARALAASLGVDGHVTFTGMRRGAELWSALAAADVCVDADHVNPMNDISTMIKTLEYMAMAKPVVQYETTEGRASAGDTALYARPNDPVELAERIAELLDDPDRRAALGAAARHRVEDELAWHHQVEHLLAVYDGLVPATAPGRQSRGVGAYATLG